jgi:LacI family transcriptional regulator
MITIKDVARRAGVSVATVSRVLNKSGPVSPEAAKRIHEAAAALHYVPHGGARSLITAKTSTIGVLLPDLYGGFFSEMIRGIDQTAQQNGYHLLLSGSHNRRTEMEAAMRAMRGRTDGLIAMSPHFDAAMLVENLPPTLPVVLLSCKATCEVDHVIAIDNAGGAEAMVNHLIALGHRRIAMVMGEEGHFDTAERLQGYRRALEAAGIALRPEYEAQGDFSEASGHRAVQQLLTLPERPTAIFCANDSMCIGGLAAASEAGVRVPADLTMVGFDDIPLAQYLSPPLTSVHVPVFEMGARAVSRLIAVLKGEPVEDGKSVRLPTRLVVRSSCAPPPKPA